MQELVGFETRVQAFESGDADAFHALLTEGTELLGGRRYELCEHFDVTTATVDRWLEGRSTPHPAFRGLVLEHLAERAMEDAEVEGAQVQQRAVADA